MFSIRRGARRGPYRGAWIPLNSSSRTTLARRHATVRGVRASAHRCRGLPRQGPRDDVRQVEVADAHRIGVAECADGDLGRGPRTDPRHRGKARLCHLERELGDGLEPVGTHGDPPDELGPTPLDPERVVGVVGERGKGASGRRQPEPEGRRSRCWFAVPGDEAAPRPPRLVAGDLLLEDRRHERLEDGSAPRRAHGAEPPVQLADEGMVIADRGGLPLEPEQRRHACQRAFRAGPPGLRTDAVTLLDEREGGRTVGGPGGSPGLAATQSQGRISGSAAQRRKSQGEVERSLIRVGSCGHRCSLSRFRNGLHSMSNGPQRSSMVRLSRRATPQGRRERGAHRHACQRRRARLGRFAGPQPIRPAGRRSLPGREDSGCCPRAGDDD